MINDIFAQVENVPLNDPVYGYLKEMEVKRIITGYNDDDPNLSRFEVAGFLDTIQNKISQLSHTERKLLNKYRIEFVPEVMDKKNTASMFKSNMNVSSGFKYLFSQKQKYLFSYEKNKNNVFVEPLGNLYYVTQITPEVNKNAEIFDVGFRFRGTVFRHLGYNFSVAKGGADGDSILIESAFPQIKSTFKYVEDIENITNYEFVTGYLKYYTEPDEGMGLSVQLGREQLKYGVGYSERLALSGDSPDMNFLKFKFDYGILHFSSIFASTVGEYSDNRDLRYTKYFTANRLKLSFENLFEAGIGETVISSRGIELGYVNPLIFYKFLEMSLQDRDNGTLFFDLQTHFLKDFELQGTFFLDENILSNLSDMSKATNKSAYQVGFFYYEPLGLRDFSLQFEYTKIRPFVYSHYDQENTYTSFGTILGHSMGPNADQIFTKLNYNLNDRVSMSLEYQKIRKGKNEYNEKGELVKNVGGDVYIPYRDGTDDSQAYFLDGIRINYNYLRFNISLEPVKNYLFDVNYLYNTEDNLSSGDNFSSSLAYIRFSFRY
ncbi:MAG: hypothetical protein JNJ56_02115 [Ignavibacteria bacterium]|nr:hypothetical protein [Ignavibacteria bacterium]